LRGSGATRFAKLGTVQSFLLKITQREATGHNKPAI